MALNTSKWTIWRHCVFSG